jgi:putative DNA-invertase from lambdoid prophage Rac
MTRLFAYARVSNVEQSTDNQVLEIKAAGFAVEPRRIVAEKISGGVPAAGRPGFSKLLDRMEPGDVLVVTKLDRLGRNAMDVRDTVDRLATLGVRVHCLALGGVDLTSAAGRMPMGVLNAVAEFERDLLIERTRTGLERARLDGASMGRPSSLSAEQQEQVRMRLAAGDPIAQVARDFRTTRQTIMRVREKAHDGKLHADDRRASLE